VSQLPAQPRDQCLVDASIEIRCPSYFRGKDKRVRSPLQCERGVGHPGVCCGGRHEWLMTDQETLVTESMVTQLVEKMPKITQTWGIRK
jgi:hypothetical protein